MKTGLGIDGGFDLLSDVKYRDDVRLLVGPIIGTVTSNSNGMDASLNASAYTSTSFATIEPTMHDMHTLCHAMLTSGSQVLVFVGDGSAEHEMQSAIALAS